MADLYIGAALEFSCVEVVRSIDYNEAGRVDGRGLIRNNYLYSGSEEGLREVRAPTKVKSLDDVEGRMQKRGAWLYLDRAYFWTLMFHESRSGMMEYALEPHEPKKGARTVRISFRPLPPVVKDANDWYGSAIVDLDTYQLLHAEGYKTDDYERRRRLLELMESDEELPVAVDDRTFVVIKVATEFGEEKNGLRLPSRVAVTKTKFRVKGPAGQRRWREIPIGKVRQTYKDYRFYRVWSTQQVHAHMLGKDAALASPQPERATPETAAPQEKTVADDADWPETGPPPPGIAYEESFDWSMDNEEAVREWESKGWLIGFSEKGIWTGEVSDGVYRLSNRHHESESYTQTLSFGEDRGDAPIATRVMLERITRRGRPAAGLLYRYTPGTIPLYYVYVLTHSGDVEFRRRTEGGFKLLYRAPVDDFEWGRFHELRIAGSGDSFELWLDGELLTVVSDEGLRGLPGIFASGRGRYVFDDLTLFFP